MAHKGWRPVKNAFKLAENGRFAKFGPAVLQCSYHYQRFVLTDQGDLRLEQMETQACKHCTWAVRQESTPFTAIANIPPLACTFPLPTWLMDLVRDSDSVGFEQYVREDDGGECAAFKPKERQP